MAIKSISLREFQLKASQYLKELPRVLTQYNLPKYIVLTHVEYLSLIDSPVISDVISETNYVATEEPELKSEPKAEIEFHQCSWNKAYQCKSPGVIKKGNKWFCIVHGKELL